MKLLPLLLLLSGAAYASVTGILLNAQMVTTVTYQQAWQCTYSVNGQTVSVVMQNYCPGSMQFN